MFCLCGRWGFRCFVELVSKGKRGVEVAVSGLKVLVCVVCRDLGRGYGGVR